MRAGSLARRTLHPLKQYAHTVQMTIPLISLLMGHGLRARRLEGQRMPTSE